MVDRKRQLRGTTLVVVALLVGLCLAVLAPMIVRAASTRRADAWYLADRHAEELALSTVEEMVWTITPRAQGQGSTTIAPGAVPVPRSSALAGWLGPLQVSGSVAAVVHPDPTDSTWGFVRMMVEVRLPGRRRRYAAMRPFSTVQQLDGTSTMTMGAANARWETLP